MEYTIPLCPPCFDEREEDAVRRVLRSGWIAMGPETKAFEREFAAFVGAKHAIAVSSCTAALHLSLLALGVGPGDEVIVPSLTFVATANAVLAAGARPILADIDSLRNPVIGVEGVGVAATAATKAVIPVHYAGFAAEALEDWPMIEDCAHAIGTYRGDKHVGTRGAFGCFSFYANKNMTTAEGGMVVTDDLAASTQLRVLRSHYRGGLNYRMDDIRAAIGRVQLEKLPDFNRKRGELVAEYRRLLADVPEVTLPFGDVCEGVSWHIMPILLPPGIPRHLTGDRMAARGVETTVHYQPVHKVLEIGGRDLPVTEEYARRELTLPLHPQMGHGQVKCVVEALKESIGGT